jgi:hypothetical protein
MEEIMRSLIAGALVIGTLAAGLLSAAPARADDHWRGHDHWDHHGDHWDHHYRGPVYVPAPVVRYYPAPRYVYVPPPPPPVYYYEPEPAGVNLNFTFPLR